uniref:Putative kazal protease inhibitor-like protein n=1 Tax=Rhipicephalus microplus TaxID=6941 RepID=A0A6G5A7G9_RHIMP
MATTKTLLPYLILFAILVLNGNCRPQNTHANVTLRERSRSDYEYCLKQTKNMIPTVELPLCHLEQVAMML